jgi:hypothetical protein
MHEAKARGRQPRAPTRLLWQKKWTEAEPLLRECLAICGKAQPDLWSTFNTQSMFGGASLGQKKFAEAEPLLRKGYEGMKEREKTIPPQAGTRLPEALDRLIEFSTATSKPDEIKKSQAERARYPASAPPPGKNAPAMDAGAQSKQVFTPRSALNSSMSNGFRRIPSAWGLRTEVAAHCL